MAFRRDQLRFLTRLHERYGDAATIALPGGRRIFFLASPEAVGHVLVSGARNFTSREVNLPSLPFLGDGLLNIDGLDHRTQRALVQPAFGRRQVEAYGDLMLSYADGFVGRWQTDQVVEMRREMAELTLQIVAGALLGLDIREDSPRLGLAFNDIVRYSEERSFPFPTPRIDLPFLPYGRFQRASRYLDARVEELIRGRRASGRRTGDVLSSLIGAAEQGAPLTERRLRDHVMTLLAAGHETTSNALTFTFHLLARHPRERERLRAELERELRGRPPAPAELDRLPYLDMVVREALRLYPPAWVQGRRATGPYTAAGYRFPAGSFTLVSQWVTHRSPRWWREPGRFWPERWLPPDAGGQVVPPFAWFPFGAGPRTCIGMPFALMEARLLTAFVLQRFTPELLPGERLRLEPVVTLRPAGGTRMRLARAR